MRFKLAFIAEFNRMEAQLRSQATQPALTIEHIHAIGQAIVEASRADRAEFRAILKEDMPAIIQITSRSGSIYSAH